MQLIIDLFMSAPREILRRYDLRPNKKLGQSFLVDISTIHRIADVARISDKDTVVEIGAGVGVLTHELSQMAKHVIAVEVDPRLVEILGHQFGHSSHVTIQFEDILKFDYHSKSNEYRTKLKVVGNVPYNISSPLIFQLIANRSAIESFTLMLQKEVVDRLVSEPGKKSYGVPSVLLQMYADVDRLFDVPSDFFYPKPKVQSSIIQGQFLEKPRFHLEDEDFFRSVVRAAFAQRRKILMNNLKHAKFLHGFDEACIESDLKEIGIDGKRRGETLTVHEFSRLSNILKYRLTNHS